MTKTKTMKFLPSLMAVLITGVLFFWAGGISHATPGPGWEPPSIEARAPSDKAKLYKNPTRIVAFYKGGSDQRKGRIEVTVMDAKTRTIFFQDETSPEGEWTLSNSTPDVIFDLPPLSDVRTEYTIQFDLDTETGYTHSITTTFSFAETPSAYFTATPYSGPGPLQVEFDASFNVGENEPFAYRWTFGDGETGSGSTIVHEYISGGKGETIYNPSLDVEDSQGVRQSYSLPVGVGGGPVTLGDLQNVSGLVVREYIKAMTSNPNFDPRTDLYDKILILRREAMSQGELASATYKIVSEFSSANYNMNSQFVFDGENQSYLQWQQYKIMLVHSGDNRISYGTESLPFLFQFPPKYPIPEATEGTTRVKAQYNHTAGVNGWVQFRAVGIQGDENYLYAICDVDSEVIQESDHISVNNGEYANWNIRGLKEGDYFVCARAGDDMGNDLPWYHTAVLVGSPPWNPYNPSQTIGTGGGGIVILTVLPSAVTGGGGISNISPDAPLLVSPADGKQYDAGSGIDLTATFKDFNNDTGYLYFRVSSDIDCTSAVTEGKGTTIESGQSDTWTVSKTLDPGTYYWCAKAFDASSYDSIWSASNKFVVAQATTTEQPSNTNGNQQNTDSTPPSPTKATNGSVIGEYQPIPGPAVPPSTNRNTNNTPPPAGGANQNNNTNNDTSKQDTDEDTFTDFNEEFIFGTESGNPVSKPDPLSNDVTIANIHDNDIVTTANPFVVGQARSNSFVSVFVLNSDGKELEIGKAVSDLEGRYALTSDVALPNGVYKMYAKGFNQSGTLISTSPDIINIRVDVTISLPPPIISSINGEPYKEGDPVVVYTQKPTFSGTYQGDGEIFAFWQSIVTGSQGILSPMGDQTFTVQPEEPLSIGNHKVTIYLAKTENNVTTLGKLTSIDFEIKPSEKAPIIEPDQELVTLDGATHASAPKQDGNFNMFLIVGLILLVVAAGSVLIWNNFYRHRHLPAPPTPPVQ